MSLDCALVVLNYNGRQLLEACLPTVIAAARNAEGSHEVALLDNGSSDGSFEWAKQAFPDITCVRASANRFLVSYNEFLARTQRALVFLLNSDVALQEDCLPPMLRHFTDRRVFSVAPLILNEEGREVENGRTYLRFSRGWFRYHQADLRVGLTATASVAAGMYDRQKLLSFGGFDDLLFPMYGEEMDLTLSAYRRGWVVHFEPQSVVHHVGGASINTAVSRRHRRGYLVKNRHLSILKHVHSWRLLMSYFFWTALCLPGRALLFDRAYFAGSCMALRQFAQALKRRRYEMANVVVKDRDLFSQLSRLKESVDLQP